MKAPPLPEWLAAAVPQTDYSPPRLEAALAGDLTGPPALAALLHPAADAHLERMAQRARAITRRHFGRAITLYAPLYLSNHCSSGCVYCGFASDRPTPRRRLGEHEVRQELDALHKMGFGEILLLTGERSTKADLDYLLQCVRLAAASFPRVTIETFPMATGEYRALVEAGCTGVTLYQETYDPENYAVYHRWGPKRDYAARLDAPARALEAGMRTAGIGALLGLSEPILEACRLLAHAEHLRRAWWRSGITLSFPRIRPEAGTFQAPHPVSDRLLARMICAFRICLPDTPLVLSTREAPAFRDGMAGIGINKMSAASRTTVGGYQTRTGQDTGQFDVSDDRDAAAFCNALKARGLEPVFKDWDAAYREEEPPS